MSGNEAAARSSAARVQPFFLDTPRGPIFCLYRSPAARAPRRNVLVVQAFNEEMNRCRSMLTLQGEAFASIGVGMLIVDLFGTGDSGGHHGDATWAGWLSDIAIAARWLDQQPGGCTDMLGIRLGALLAAQASHEAPQRLTQLLLWQPVVDGKQHFTQFLRVKIAALMDRPDVAKLTTASMREQFAAGQSVEVAGYDIHPELAHAIDAAKLAQRLPRQGTGVLWLEQPPPGATEPPPPSIAALQAWRAAGLSCEHVAFEGPAFWQQYERTLAPALIELTARWPKQAAVAA